MSLDPEHISTIAKAIAAFAFRNGPIEDIHAAPSNRVSQEEMKALMKYAVDHVYALLVLWQDDPQAFGEYVSYVAEGYAYAWDEPENTENAREVQASLLT